MKVKKDKKYLWFGFNIEEQKELNHIYHGMTQMLGEFFDPPENPLEEKKK